MPDPTSDGLDWFKAFDPDYPEAFDPDGVRKAYQGPFNGPWGNRAELPPPAPEDLQCLRQEAEALRTGTLDSRISRLAMLIVGARLHGVIGSEDEIITAAGFSPTRFWWTYIPRQTTPEAYVMALSRMMADPAERQIEGDLPAVVPENGSPRRAKAAPILWQLRRVLERAHREGETFFVRVKVPSTAVTLQAAPPKAISRVGLLSDTILPPQPRARPPIEILTDAAGAYIAADPRGREMLHPSYVTFLEAGGHVQPYPATPPVSPVVVKQAPVPVAATPVPSTSPAVPKRKRAAPKVQKLLDWRDTLPKNKQRQAPYQLAEQYDKLHPDVGGRDQKRYARDVFRDHPPKP